MKRTQKDFEEFKRLVKHYLKLWGINDWDARFKFGGTTALANTSFRTTKQIAVFSLSQSYEKQDQDRTIKQLAKHEAAHILIANLDALVGNYCTEDEATKATEGIVIRLESLLPD